MTLFSVSRAVVGLVRVMDFRAERTSWVGSLMKCLASISVSRLLYPLDLFAHLHDMVPAYYTTSSHLQRRSATLSFYIMARMLRTHALNPAQHVKQCPACPRCSSGIATSQMPMSSTLETHTLPYFSRHLPVRYTMTPSHTFNHHQAGIEQGSDRFQAEAPYASFNFRIE